MSIGDLFWLFFIFSAIQPMLRQRMLEAMRMRKIAQLERQRKSRMILLVHRQETMRLLGFPIARYIDINDSEDVLRAIQMTDAGVPLDLARVEHDHDQATRGTYRDPQENTGGAQAQR